ncbi:DUF445 family protein [Staphylococcus epidermidis]|uniref:DUF445 domain-containing protein n=2 Tax=Staphylococcus epidermidis TaxID=1282 RepID=UPI000F447F29|nr:DUF445 family protein [Staphylococcus epidermidis]MBF2214475.1 DUF445 domain-containing protein [Staphylococcus epidermidis]MBM0803064.1 DUF445 family protein [Staphylococcus epidermidis]MCG1084570.1 DUF445 family protein [Staphylococcus epidermidis]MCG1729505.1 DUF445 family protein [Staphylococcus epidermidis]MCG2227799.1 DUF445 family protein [Staphylococcus epidermidis]
MHSILLVVFMIILGAIIGGVTNMIAIKMLFHPFKPYYIFRFRIPFTPGLIPKRREEIARKIGQVIEEHLITEELIRQKLNQQQSRNMIQQLIQKQISKLKNDDVTIKNIAKFLGIDVNELVDYKLTTKVLSKLNFWYEKNKYRKLSEILSQSFLDQCKGQIEYITDFLCERARNYLSSEKGERDIYEMLDTFFNEKGRIIGLLQMFMTKESIADRIQQELIRLTQHPQSQIIITKVLNDEYETFKDKNLDEIIKAQQFKNYSQLVLNELKTYLNLKDKTQRPINQIVPQFIQFLEDDTSKRMTDLIIKGTSKHLTNIMKKINLRQLIEEQINTFDLKYIENLIIEIANKELKLIMTLGFILGGIIGFFQGVIAIFV